MLPDYESMARADDRLDRLEDQRTARLIAAGHTHCQCDVCGEIRTVRWLNGHCNNYDATGIDEMCMGRYVLPTLPLSNPVTGTVRVPMKVAR